MLCHGGIGVLKARMPARQGRFFRKCVHNRTRQAASRNLRAGGCKPDSVGRRTVRAAISLAPLARNAPLARGATITRNVSRSRGTAGAGRHSCSVLHRTGFVLPRRLLAARWALTPPFHPYPPEAGGMFSATLSVAADLRPSAPRLRAACCPEVSGLSSARVNRAAAASHPPCRG